MGRRRYLSVPLAAVAWLAVTTPDAAAQPVPLSEEIIVNATPGAYGARVASDAAGNFVVVWHQGGETRARRYDADGAARGTEFLVTADTTAVASMDVAMAPDGSFVVTWLSSTPSVVARAFDEEGTSRGDAFRVDTTIFDYHDGHYPGSNGDIKESPRVAAYPDGRFMVVWSGGYNAYLYNVHHRRSVRAQRIDETGALLEGEFSVAGDGYYYLEDPDVASNAAGEFVVAWNQTTSYNYYYHDEFPYMTRTPNTELQASRVGGSEVEVGPGLNPITAIQPDGGFIVVWGPANQARLFDDSSQPLGSVFTVTHSNTTSGGDVAAAPDASFVVTWSTNDSQASDGSGYGVLARAFAPDGAPRGDAVVLNSYTTGAQVGPRVTFTGDGTMVVVWHGDNAQDGSSVVARRFARAPSCGDASADATLSASDALTALATAVGGLHCAACVCDVDQSGAIAASDALAILRASVGQLVELACNPC